MKQTHGEFGVFTRLWTEFSKTFHYSAEEGYFELDPSEVKLQQGFLTLSLVKRAQQRISLNAMLQPVLQTS